MKFYIGEEGRVSVIECDNPDLFEDLYYGEVNKPAKQDYNSVMHTLVKHPLVLFRHPAIEATDFVTTLPLYIGMGTQSVMGLTHYAEYEDMYAVVLGITLDDRGYYAITAVGLRKPEVDSAIRKALIDEFLDV